MKIHTGFSNEATVKLQIKQIHNKFMTNSNDTSLNQFRIKEMNHKSSKSTNKSARRVKINRNQNRIKFLWCRKCVNKIYYKRYKYVILLVHWFLIEIGEETTAKPQQPISVDEESNQHLSNDNRTSADIANDVNSLNVVGGDNNVVMQEVVGNVG